MGTNRENNEERINVSPQIYVIHHDAENYALSLIFGSDRKNMYR